MTTATNTLGLIVATLVMLVAGIQQKRLEWKRRDHSWLNKRKKRKAPTNGWRAET